MPKIPRRYSLKRRLLSYLLVCLLFTWSGIAYLVYHKIHDEIDERFKAELAQSARIVQSLIDNLISHNPSLTKKDQLFQEPIFGFKYERKIAFQLQSLNAKKIVLRSESAPNYPLSPLRNGYNEIIIKGEKWQVYSLSDERGEYVAHVAQQFALLENILNTITSQLTWVFLLALPVLTGLVWLVVERTLRPVIQLKTQLSARAVGFLEPLPLAGLPEEIVPVVEQLNTLFLQLQEAFENERQFTADASHELRNPLAGLLAQIQVAQKTTEATRRDQALSQAQHAVQRMSRMVQQLLSLSRVQHRQAVLQQEPVDLNAHIIILIGDMDRAAHAKQITVEFIACKEAMIRSNPQLTTILLRNLLENAIKYTPEHGKVQMSTQLDSQYLSLWVEDSGAGVAEEDYSRLAQPFFRRSETANIEGSGLGLSIVQRTVASLDAQLSFGKSALGGLRVEIKFKRLPAIPVLSNTV